MTTAKKPSKPAKPSKAKPRPGPKNQQRGSSAVGERGAHNPDVVGSTPTPASIRADIACAAAHGYPYYVYTLADASGVFYVGKGKGGRLFSHGRTAGDRNTLKLERIARAPGEIDRQVVAYFRDEGAAFGHEAALIAEFVGLTNIAPSRADPRELAKAQARTNLARMVPFHVFAARNQDFDWSILGCNSAQQCYGKFVEILTHESIHPTPSGFVVVERTGGQVTVTEVWER